MNQLRKFMYGRYGFDQLSRALAFAGLAIALVAAVTKSSLLLWLAYVPIIYSVFRSLSRNTGQRAKENYIYCEAVKKVKVNLRNVKLLMIGTKTHKYFRCKNCRQIIRIPRGKGKVSISCPKCRKEFISRT